MNICVCLSIWFEVAIVIIFQVKVLKVDPSLVSGDWLRFELFFSENTNGPLLFCLFYVFYAPRGPCPSSS